MNNNVMKSAFGRHRRADAPGSIPRRKSIFLRTLLLSWIIVVITLTIFVFTIIPYQRAELQNEMKIQAGVAFSSVSQVVENSLVLEDYSTIVDHCLAMIQTNPSLLFIVITRHDGFALVHTPTNWSQKTLDDQWLPVDRDPGEPGQFVVSDLVGKEVYKVSFPFRYSGIDWGWIHVGLAPDKYYADLKSLYVRIGLTSVLAISLGMVFSFSFAGRISRPIMLLERVARNIRKGDLTARARIASGDEVESLAESFNRMAEHLQNEITEKESEIRERKEAEAALRESEERYRTMIEQIEDGYYEVDLYGKVTFCNEVMVKILGYPLHELTGMDSVRLIGEDQKKTVFREFAKVFVSGSPISVFGFEIQRRDGRKRQIETSISLMNNIRGEKIGFRGIARDVHERKQQENQLIYTAYHDALTGLKNRKWFYEKLAEVLAHAGRYRYRVFLLYIDIDNFKQVNDDMGHEAGDLLLTLIADRLRGCLRQADKIARIGGDEFTIVLDNPAETASAEIVAGKVIEQIGSPYLLKGQTIDFITASIGVSAFPEGGADLESLVKRADRAMYRAKRSGNRYTVDPPV